MNNYCTNCGKQLAENDKFCTNCGTPIVDIPYDYVPPVEKENKKKKLKKLGKIILGIVAIILIILIVNAIKHKNLQKKYVEPFLGEGDYKIKYASSGKCVISGDCVFDIALGCDGGACEVYKYLPKDECKSYYYNVNDGKEKFTITVFKKDGKYSTVKGKNIYGKDNEENLEDEPEYDEEIGIEEDKNIYYEFNNNTDNNKIFMNDGMYLYFETEIINNETNYNIITSGYVYNPTNSTQIIPLNVEYYDENYNSVGFCHKDIELLGENHPEVPYTCSILEEEIYNIRYFKININNY